ncbi:MAG TPA: protein kinase [Gemmatimonadales bacterium]|jgi:tetratricopeptide (TPR) repeat protein/tRNA A-37 threonylcarbamoyl transferase component Bud32
MSDFRERLEQSLSGSYTIQRELGGGGMSRVFVAQEQKLGRTVVIKLLSPDLAAAMSASRFEREIRLAASLQQANIVPVLASGDVDGLPYYTMPFVEGESLRARLGRGIIPIADVISILRDVIRALAYAHERGVVHRDIKPDNVLLSGHTAVVTDFGIAKAISAATEGPAGATLTQLGTSIGTPAYMAPEQAAGDPATDYRADIYAFGCTAYELLTGQELFPGFPVHRLLVAHMSQAPKAIAGLRPDCPPALAALVMQCLAKDPIDRPASANELLRRLDEVAAASGALAMLPAILIGGKGILWRALALYALAFIVVAIVARAAIIAIGLPDWVFPGALIVMALGLPAILFTAYTQYIVQRRATATPAATPSLANVPGTMATLAIKASPHMSWRRTLRGGMVMAGVFVLLVAGFMTLRAMGLGPAGSLLASGKLTANDNILVAAFDSPGADSSLGPTIAEAVRTTLSQSHAVHVMPTTAVVAALEQMKRPDTARVDFTTAREIAQRSGAKAVVSGSVVSAGVGYVITVRLIAAQSGDELASFSESAKDAGDLIPAVDRVTKSLRGKIGESLKTVRGTPPLQQVTTASLGALRSYTAALFANDVKGDFPTAVQDFNDAIRQDSTFAMAYAQLSYSLLDIGGSARNAEAAAAMTTAFRLRDRLPERERYNVEGSYYLSVAHDRAKATTALQHAADLDSTDVDVDNNLAITLAGTGNGPGAVRAYQRAIASDTSDGTVLENLGLEYANLGKFRESDSVASLFSRRHIPYPTFKLRYVSFWGQRKYDSAEQVARAAVDSADPVHTATALTFLAQAVQLRGQLHQAEQLYARAGAVQARARGETPNPYLAADAAATTDGWIRGNPAKGIAHLDSVLHAYPVASVPLSRDISTWLAADYGMLGDGAKARAVLTAHEARLDTTARLQDWTQLGQIRGLIAMDEGKTDSAVAWFRRAAVSPDGLPAGISPAYDAWLLGTAFDRGNRPDSARKYLTEYIEMPGGERLAADATLLGLALLRLAELDRDAGDTKDATEYYGRFIDLWKNADADLQPRVTQARKELAEMMTAKG